MAVGHNKEEKIMKYAVTKVVNGNFFIVSEHGEDLPAAKNAFWDQCKALNNAPDVITATVAVMDENQDIVANKREFISHEVQPNE